MRPAEWLDLPYTIRLAVRVGRFYGLSKEDIADLKQELLLALCKLPPECSVNVSWLFRTASHKAVDILRARAKLGRSLPSPAESFLSPETRYLLQAEISKLPQQLRVVARLLYEVGLTEREAAKYLHLCRASVRWRERRCLAALRGDPDI